MNKSWKLTYDEIYSWELKDTTIGEPGLLDFGKKVNSRNMGIGDDTFLHVANIY